MKYLASLANAFVNGLAMGVGMWAGLVLGFVVLGLLAGCELVPTRPVPLPPVIVGDAITLPPQKIPVPIPCVKKSQVPKVPATWMNNITQTGEQLEAAMAADLLEAKAYIIKASSLLDGCIEEFASEK